MDKDVNDKKIGKRYAKSTGDAQGADLVEILDALKDSDKSDGEDLTETILEVEAKKKRELEHRRILDKRSESEAQKAKGRGFISKASPAPSAAHIDSVTSMELPLDWENIFNSDERTQGVHLDNIPDALVKCLTELGYVDIEYISSITGQELKTVITSLKGAIYQDPAKWDEVFYKGWETSDEYLSGNLFEKLQIARKANKLYRGYFSQNVAALEALLPQGARSEEIYVTLGSPWVPTDIIADFVNYMLGFRTIKFAGTVLRDEVTGKWQITAKNMYYSNIRAVTEFGTPTLNALYILEKTLNMSSVTVYDEVSPFSGASGDRKKVENEAETLAALDKQRKQIETFREWVWKDEKRKERLERIFRERYGCVRRRIFDGSFLTFPGLSENIKLYPYQKDAVARIIFTPNTLLAHDVGAGKTYVMIAAAMELKRMRLSKKNLFVVPNNLVGQWRDIFKAMYPSANLLVVEPRNFTPDKRDAVLMRIASEDFDGIIMAYSSFELIPLSLESKKVAVNEQLIKVNRAIEANRPNIVPQLTRKQTSLIKKRRELLEEDPDDPSTPFFDKLGVTRLFVDEAHNYKNVPIDTNADHVYGISSSGSQKCKDMLEKVRIVQRQNMGKGVVLATGTPITNSVTDAYIMQLYLQSGELSLLDLQNFDSWAGMFAEKTTNFEIDVDTNKYRLVTRFSRFHNLPELTSMLSMIADFHQADGAGDIPELDGGHDCVIERTPEFERYLKTISDRAEAVRAGKVDRKVDNMLKITVDGRKAALDYRLVDPKAQFTPKCKVAKCAYNVWQIYAATRDKKSAQLVFCDTSTPKSGFNMYDELKRLLVAYGIKPSEIAFVHEGDSEKQRAALFKSVNSGDIAVLIGSTFKLGLGVNVQERLIALHHLDVPWRPADMTQREGRILRQGNTNKTVGIFRYITEGSFDAYSWQLLETKARFIAELLGGTLTARSGSDIEDTVLSYAEVKALAVGNPLVKERVEVSNELERYIILQRKAGETNLRLENELVELPARIKSMQKLCDDCRQDYEFYIGLKSAPKSELTPEQKKAAIERRRNLRERLQSEIDSNILETSERTLFKYHGFEVILPTNMSPNMPYIFLKRVGKYSVDMTGSEIGNLRKIDMFLEGLGEHLARLEDNVKQLKKRRTDIRAQIKTKEDFSERIDELRKKLDKIDKKLKVDKK